jgi:hypothetical protein
MARTEAGRTLTEEHRQAQIRLRAASLRDFIQLWPLWQGDERSFQTLIAATTPLVRAYRQASGDLAAAYYRTFRAAENPGGEASPRLADPIDEARLAGTLYVVGRKQTAKAIAAGQPAELARRTALVRTSGSVTRFILEAGRETVIRSAAADRQALGWARVTAGEPCAFCAMLASRGPVYAEDTVGFRAHDHCTCTAEPAYRDSEWPGRAREFRELYNRHAAGTENPVNELRRVLEGRA